jgi:hypothetical protein
MLEEWKNCFRCENHLRLQEEYLEYFRDFMHQYIRFPGDMEGIGRWCAESPQELTFEEWCEKKGDKPSYLVRTFEYWGRADDEDDLVSKRRKPVERAPFSVYAGDVSNNLLRQD